MSECILPNGNTINVAFRGGACSLPDGNDLHIAFGGAGIMVLVRTRHVAPSLLRAAVSAQHLAPAKLTGAAVTAHHQAPSALSDIAHARHEVPFALRGEIAGHHQVISHLADHEVGNNHVATATLLFAVSAHHQSPASLRHQRASHHQVISHLSAIEVSTQHVASFALRGIVYAAHVVNFALKKEIAANHHAVRWSPFNTVAANHAAIHGVLGQSSGRHIIRNDAMRTTASRCVIQSSVMLPVQSRHSVNASAMSVVNNHHSVIAGMMQSATAHHSIRFGMMTAAANRHSVNANAMIAVANQHLAPSLAMSGAAARHLVPSNVMALAQSHHSAPFMAMLAASSRHTIKFGMMTTAANRHSVSASAMQQAPAHHSIRFGMMTTAKNHHQSDYQAMTAVSSNNAASAANLPTLIARNTIVFSVNHGAAAHHRANASQLNSNPVHSRHVANASMPDAEIIIQAGITILTHGGRDIPLCGQCEVSGDEGSSFWSATLNLDAVDDYAQISIGDALILSMHGAIFNLICDSKQYGRDDPPTYRIKAFSPVVLLGSAWSAKIVLGRAEMARATVERILVQPVDWQIPDWRLPTDAAELEATPLELAQQIIGAVGGVLESLPDGSLLARRTDPISIPDYPLATAIPLTDRDLYAHSASIDNPVIANRFVITSGAAGSNQNEIQIEATQDENNPHHYTIRAYPMPWRPVSLVHTGDVSTAIGARIETTLANDELIAITKGEGSLKYPAHSIDATRFQYADLGAITQPDAKSIKTATAEYSLLSIQYQARAWEWEAVNPRTEDIQFLAVE